MGGGGDEPELQPPGPASAPAAVPRQSPGLSPPAACRSQAGVGRQGSRWDDVTGEKHIDQRFRLRLTAARVPAGTPTGDPAGLALGPWDAGVLQGKRWLELRTERRQLSQEPRRPQSPSSSHPQPRPAWRPGPKQVLELWSRRQRARSACSSRQQTHTHLVLATSTQERPFLEPGDNGLGVPKSRAGHGNTATLLGLDVLGGCFCEGGRSCKRPKVPEEVGGSAGCPESPVPTGK